MQLPISIPTGANLNSYIAPGMYYAPKDGKTIINAPQIDENEINGFSLLVQKNDSFGVGVAQMLTTYRNGYIYHRVFISSGWSNWKELATTEPLKKYSLNFSSGIVIHADRENYYHKDQFNEVTIVSCIATMATVASGDKLFTLPVGFRPVSRVVACGGTLVSGVYSTCTFDLFPNGNVCYYGQPLPVSGVAWSTIVFIAE